jgi:hypothetical protein
VRTIPRVSPRRGKQYRSGARLYPKCHGWTGGQTEGPNHKLVKRPSRYDAAVVELLGYQSTYDHDEGDNKRGLGEYPKQRV